MFVIRYRFGLVFFKDEEFTEVKHLFAQDDTGTGFCDLAFQQTLVVLVVEELDVAGSAAVETVFDRTLSMNCCDCPALTSCPVETRPPSMILIRSL